MQPVRGEGAKANTYPAGQMRGFTIIELLIVVAIISVLAVIALSATTQYFKKSKDAAILGIMANELTEASVFYDQNGGYQNWCYPWNGSTTYGAYKFDVAIKKVLGPGAFITCYCEDDPTGHCIAPATTWCNAVWLGGTFGIESFYCTDSTGTKKMGSICQVDFNVAATCS